MNTETITIEIIAHGGELSGGKSHDPGAYLISPSFRGVGRGKVSILVVVNYGTSAHTSSDKLQNVTGSISASRRFFLLVPTSLSTRPPGIGRLVPCGPSPYIWFLSETDIDQHSSRFGSATGAMQENCVDPGKMRF